jgi:hypothetical protein
MKKLFVFLFSICVAFSAIAQQKSAIQKLQVIDKSTNSVRQWRVYAFENTTTSKIDLESLGKDLKAVKGFINLQESSTTIPNIRFVIYMNMDMILGKSTEILNVFKKHNLEITNIPVEAK